MIPRALRDLAAAFTLLAIVTLLLAAVSAAMFRAADRAEKRLEKDQSRLLGGQGL